MAHKIGIQFNVDTKELKKLNELSKQIDDVKKKLKDLPNTGKPSGSGGVDKITKSLQTAATDTAKLSKNFKQASRDMEGGMDIMKGAAQKLSQNMGKYHDNIKTTINDSGKMVSTFKDIDGTTKKVTAQFDEASGQFRDFHVQLSSMNELGKKTGETLKNLSPDPKKWDVFKHSVKENAVIIEAVDKGGGKFTQTLVDMDGRLHKVTGNINRVTGEIKELSTETKAASKNQLDMAGFDMSAQNRIGTMAESMKGLNKHTLSVGESMRIAATRMVEWGMSATLIYGTKRAFEAMIGVIVEVDGQMTELKKVMSEDTNFEKMMDDATTAANKFGQKLTDVNESLIEFGRQGLNQEQVKMMTDATLAMANVGDVAAADAASTLTGVMTIFKKEYSDAMQVVDRFNEVQNNFPITVADAASALEKAGATAGAFGVSMNDALGHVVAISAVTRESGSVVGNALKTIYSRLTTMQPAIDALESAGVEAFDSVTGEARSATDILGDLAGKWDSLSETQQQSIGVTLAGRQQLSRFYAIMENYGMAVEATEVAENSWGSAMEENQKYMESLPAKINGVKTTLQELALTAGEKGVAGAFGGFLEVSGNVLTGLTGIIDKFGFFQTLIGGGVLITVTKLIQQFRGLKDNSWAVEQGLKGANDIMQGLAGKSDVARDAVGRLYYVMGDLKTGLANLAGTVLANPFTWVAVATIGITAFMGHLDKLKQKEKELGETADQMNQKHIDFAKAINANTLDVEQFESYTSYATQMGNAYDKVKEQIQKATEDMFPEDTFAGANQLMALTGESFNDIADSAIGSQKATQFFNEETQELIANMGITNIETGTVNDVMREFASKMDTAKKNTELAKEAMREQKEQGLAPLKQSFNELSEEIEATGTALQIMLGLTDQAIANAYSSYNQVAVTWEKGAKATDEELAAVEANLESLSLFLGKDVEWIKKNWEETGKLIDQKSKLNEKYAESDQRVLTEKEVATAAKESSKQQKESDDAALKNFLDNNNKRTENMKEATTQKQKALLDQMNADDKANGKYLENKNKEEKRNKEFYANKQKQLMDDMEKNSLAGKSEEEIEKAKQNAKEKTKNKTKSTSDEIKKENDKTAKNNKKNADAIALAQGNIQDELETSKSSFFLFGDSAETAEKDSTSAGDTMSGKDGIKGAIDSISSAIESVCGWWDDFKEKCKNPITGKISITGILGGIFQGGDPNAKIKEAAETAAGGSSIAGRGFGGLRLTSPFGMRKHPITGKTKFHSGIDLAGPAGTPIRARAGGVVTYSGYNDGYGNMVQIRTNDGTVYRYAHNQSNKVKVGNIVAAGQTIGFIGSTGNSTGPHIHFEVRKNGIAINPTAYYHSGGIVDKQRKTNEVDARLQVGEMVLTHAQQSNLFKMLSNKNHSTLKGHGVDEGGSRKQYFGQGGPTYSVRAGDTLSEIAVKYYGNAYNGGLKKLLKLNPKLNMNSVLRIGQKINVPSGNTKTSTAKKTTAKKTPALTAAQSEKQSQAVLDYMNKMEDYNAYGYDSPKYKVNKLLDNRYKFVKANNDIQQNFNNTIIDALSQYTDKNAAKKAFKQAGLFDLNAAQKNSIWKSISKKIDENIQSAYDAKADKVFDYMSKMEGYGAKGYDAPAYDVWKMQTNRKTFTKASAETKEKYNSTIISALHEYTNAKTAKTLFNKSGFFGLSKAQLNKIWQGIQESINENIFDQWNEKTSEWLTSFQNKVKEANENVKVLLEAYNGIRDRKINESREDYVGKKSNAILESLGLDFEKLDEAQKIEKQMADIQAKIQARADESALLEYRLLTKDDTKRLNELQKYINQVNAQISKTSTQMKKQGITDTKLIAEAQQPLKDKLAELKAEYNELSKAMSGSEAQIKQNATEMEKLAEEYKKLEQQLESTGGKREFTDMWGNLVHSAEGATVEITEQGQIILNTYANIKRELDKIKNITATGSGISAVVAPILESLTETVKKYAPSGNLEITPSDAYVTTNNDSTVYQADTNSNRNVTYVVQTGVALASESELREFAMVLAGMIEEERARGNS